MTISVFSPSGREVLTANRTYYVRTDGSDSNNGLTNSAGGAFLTIGAALALIQRTLDLAGQFVVTVSVQTGTYTTSTTLSGPFVGANGFGSVILQGDTVTPSNVVLSTAGNILQAQYGAQMSLQGFKFTSSAGLGLISWYGAQLQVSSCEYGAVSIYHNWATRSGIIDITGTNTLSGASINFQHSSHKGDNRATVCTLNITADLAFTQFIRATMSGSDVTWTQSTINLNAHTVTGIRGQADLGGYIECAGSGTTFWPGNSAVVATTGYEVH